MSPSADKQWVFCTLMILHVIHLVFHPPPQQGALDYFHGGLRLLEGVRGLIHAKTLPSHYSMGHSNRKNPAQIHQIVV